MATETVPKKHFTVNYKFSLMNHLLALRSIARTPKELKRLAEFEKSVATTKEVYISLMNKGYAPRQAILDDLFRTPKEIAQVNEIMEAKGLKAVGERFLTN